MDETNLSQLPPGWYPDPKGERQWRQWTDRGWTDVVRPYGPEAPTLLARLTVLQTQHAIARYGAVAFFAGSGLLIDWFHHPVSATSSLNSDVDGALAILGLILLCVGHATYVRACVAVARRDRWVAALPFANLVAWIRWSCEEASYPITNRPRPLVSRREAVFTAGLSQTFLVLALLTYALFPLPANDAVSAALHLVPAVGAILNLRWAQLLFDDANGARDRKVREPSVGFTATSEPSDVNAERTES